MEDKIKAAYESMDPTPDQEERMLAEILKAQKAAPGAPETSATQNDDNAEQSAGTNPPSPKRTGFTIWKVALPIAACLAILAVVVGVGSISQLTQPPTGSESASGPASANNADAQSTQRPPSAQMNAQADGLTASETERECIIDEPEPQPDTPHNTEEYAAVDENGFASTRTRPLSTISADVDTASYCNVRRMISDGYSSEDIPDGAVRAEEMLNYFTYDYKQPEGDNPFSTQAEVSTCPWNSDTQLLVLGFATARETSAAAKGANLVFLIDVSGSMGSPDKLDLLKDSFAALLDNLDERDRISIVTYSGSEEVVLEGASGNDDGAILEAIRGLRASGSTNGEAGLRMAYEVAEKNYIDGGVNRIVMASDGDLNVGMSSTSDLYDFVEGKRDTGVYLSVLGFGSGNYKDAKMETLADHGNGSYHYIDCVEEADRVLSERLTANMVPFADDVKVQVEFNPSQVKAYRLIGYENRAIADEDFTNDAVDAGDVGPNAQFTVAYEIVPADSAYEVAEPSELKYGQNDYTKSNSSDWLTCSLRYRMFSDGETHEQSMVVDTSTRTDKPSASWNLAAAVVEFSMIASQSNYLGTSSLDSVLELTGKAKNDAEVDGFEKLVRMLQRNNGEGRSGNGGGFDR